MTRGTRATCHPDREHRARGLCVPCYNRQLYLTHRPDAIDRGDLNAARLEDLQWMHDTGETAEGAAARLGISLNALDKWCVRHDASHLFRTMRHRSSSPRQDVA